MDVRIVPTCTLLLGSSSMQIAVQTEATTDTMSSLYVLDVNIIKPVDSNSACSPQKLLVTTH